MDGDHPASWQVFFFQKIHAKIELSSQQKSNQGKLFAVKRSGVFNHTHLKISYYGEAS